VRLRGHAILQAYFHGLVPEDCSEKPGFLRSKKGALKK
jgi:hypothetical protein